MKRSAKKSRSRKAAAPVEVPQKDLYASIIQSARQINDDLNKLRSERGAKVESPAGLSPKEKNQVVEVNTALANIPREVGV